MTIRPHLRNCPFCNVDGSDDEVLYFTEHRAICNDGHSFIAMYSIDCTNCGIQMTDEYSDDLVDRWNGTIHKPTEA